MAGLCVPCVSKRWASASAGSANAVANRNRSVPALAIPPSFRVPVAALLAGAAERHLMQD
jgi:hypothetical protein